MSERQHFCEASGLALKLAGRVFVVWSAHEPIDPAENRLYNAWFALRKIAELFLENHGTKLRPAEREMFANALLVAHDLQHDCDPSGCPRPEDCHCITAEDIRDLAETMRRDQEANRAAA